MSTATRPAPPPSVAHRVVNDAPIAPDAYLRRERMATRDKHEYLDGWIIRMPGASLSHNLIVSNLNRELHAPLRAQGCRAVTSDLRVALPSTDAYAYPDVVIFCGEPDIDDDPMDTLHNPQIVIEVLSDSTADYDRGEKFARYRQLDSLQEYVLLAQDRPHVEHYVRQDDRSWQFTETDDLDAALMLPSVEARLPLREVYLDALPADAPSDPSGPPDA